MTNGREVFRSYSIDPAELLVRAYVRVEKFAQISLRKAVFKVSAIEIMMEESETATKIVLYGGKEVRVSLPLEDVMDRIYAHDFKREPVVDLMDVTQPANKPDTRVYEIGEMVPEEGGVYFGQIKLEGLSKTFNMFAAPEDLPKLMTYVDTVEHVAGLKGWNGFDGTNYKNAKEFYAALKNGTYRGGWIVPTRDILHGKDGDGKDTTPDNIFAHKDKGSLKGTFKMTEFRGGSGCPDWYWSSTQISVYSSDVFIVRFSDGDQNWDRKDGIRLSCRPVRLVAATAAPAPG